jgi:two-component system response regulator DesR
MTARSPIRVLIADDNSDVRSAMAALIESEEDFELAGVAADATETGELAAREQPDVALIDMRMPGGGAAAAQDIMARSPATRIIGLTAFATPPAALDTDVVGCILKGSPIDLITDSVRRAAEGQPLPAWESASKTAKTPWEA